MGMKGVLAVYILIIASFPIMMVSALVEGPAVIGEWLDLIKVSWRDKNE